MASEHGPRGYLFLDVDGVLNPESGTLGGDWRVADVGQQQIWISDELGRWLQTLVAHGVEVVWATTWIEIPADLAELAHHLGIRRDLACIDRIEWDPNEGDECGKRPGVRRWLARHAVDPQTTPVAWADDQLGASDRAWADELGISAIDVPPALGFADPRQRHRIEHALDVPVTIIEPHPTRMDPHCV